MNTETLQLLIGNVSVLVMGGIWLWRITRAQHLDLKNDMSRGEQRLKDDMSQMEVRLTDRIKDVEVRLTGRIDHLSDRVDHLGEQLASHTHS